MINIFFKYLIPKKKKKKKKEKFNIKDLLKLWVHEKNKWKIILLLAAIMPVTFSHPRYLQNPKVFETRFPSKVNSFPVT